MYNNPLRILFTTLVIGSLVFSLACGNQSNTNTGNANQSANSNTANANSATSASVADMGKCDLAWTEEERKAIENAILDDIRTWGNKKLKKSLDGEGTNKPWLSFQLQRATGANEMFYEGIFTGAVAGNDQFEELADILNNYNGKKKCVRRAYFIPGNKAIPSTGSLRDVAFEWSACDFPLRPCSDGSCACN
jgi:hypothetical protein